MYDTTHDKSSWLGLLSAQRFNDSHVIIGIASNSVSQTYAITTAPQEPEDVAHPWIGPTRIPDVLFKI